MKCSQWAWLLVLTGMIFSGSLIAQETVYPAAILPFQERGTGVRDYGQKVSDILFSKLVAHQELMLVERAELSTIIQELELNLSGAITQGQAVQVGQLIGAKLLISGSVIEADSELYLVAKIIGTETSRVLGASVQGRMSDDIGPLVDQLADQLAKKITQEAATLVAKPERLENRIAAVNKALGDTTRPVISIHIPERHIGQAVIDPAVETEITLFAKECGFEILDQTRDQRQAEVVITGEGFSEFTMRRGNLVSVKARVEVKAVDRESGKVMATDRQTAIIVDLSEQLAGKAALQEAAARIAERLLPKLTTRE